jgi:hypothetical protein
MDAWNEVNTCIAFPIASTSSRESNGHQTTMHIPKHCILLWSALIILRSHALPYSNIHILSCSFLDCYQNYALLVACIDDPNFTCFLSSLITGRGFRLNNKLSALIWTLRNVLLATSEEVYPSFLWAHVPPMELNQFLDLLSQLFPVPTL